MSHLLFALWIPSIFIALVYVTSATRRRVRACGRPLPPGPPRLPIVGNLFNAPKAKPWYGFRDLCSEYGDIVYLRTFNQDMVVLGSAEAISGILEKRTANTCDRSVGPMIRLVSIDWILGVIPYGPKWRTYRRALWQHFRPGAIERYRPVQRAVTRKFLTKLLQKPEAFKDHIRFSFAATVLKIGYGIDIDDEQHEMLQVIDDALRATAEAIVPGRFLVDFIPLLQYVPGWFPGAGFQKLFAKWREASNRLKDVPFNQRNTTVYTSNPTPGCTSITDELLSRFNYETEADKAQVEELVKDVTGSMFEAGADTSFSMLCAVFLAMALWPEVQKKAQAELDAVIGPDRLPEFEDQDSLVYVNAVVKEALRWHNVAPLGIAHRSIQDDEYGGYFIPAGTTLVPNIWACMHNPDVYEDPDEFRPERFICDGKINPDIRDPSDFVFGSGRRICPGRHFEDEALFYNLACVLHVFTIGLPLDAHGDPVKIQRGMTDGFLSYPEDCRCTIKPRLANAETLVVYDSSAAAVNW